MERGRHVRKSVEDILDKAVREIPKHVVSIVRVGVGLAPSDCDAGLGNRATEVKGGRGITAYLQVDVRRGCRRLKRNQRK